MPRSQATGPYDPCSTLVRFCLKRADDYDGIQCNEAMVK